MLPWRQNANNVGRVSIDFDAIGWGYIAFFPFALVMLLLRTIYDPERKLLHELVLGFPRMVLRILFWPIGMMDAADDSGRFGGALHRRIQSLMWKSHALDGAANWQERDRIEQEIAKEALAPVRAIEDLPKYAADQGRKAVTVSSFLATVCSPFIAKASDLLQTFITGAGKGNSVLLQYQHGEDLWQVNGGMGLGGQELTLHAGPKLTLGPMIVMPDIGPVVATKGTVRVDFMNARLRVVVPPIQHADVNVFGFCLMRVPIKPRREYQLSLYWEGSVSWWMRRLGMNFIGLGLQATGTWSPSLPKTPARPRVPAKHNEDVGPLVSAKVTKAFGLDTYLGFTSEGDVSQVRFLATIAL
jgi:hypothetical protein